MDFKSIGVQLCVKYIVPAVKKIVKSAISRLGKSLYEKLYDRFKSALESFGEAVEKMFKTTEPEKLKKRLECCILGLKFFEKIHQVLEEVLPEYSAAIAEAKEKYNRITGEDLGVQ